MRALKAAFAAKSPGGGGDDSAEDIERERMRTAEPGRSDPLRGRRLPLLPPPLRLPLPPWLP